MPLVWMSFLAMPARERAAISFSVLAALSCIAACAVGARVWTPVPTVAMSGDPSTLSVTLRVTTGAVSARVTLVWAMAAIGSDEAASAMMARADFMKGTLLLGCRNGGTAAMNGR